MPLANVHYEIFVMGRGNISGITGGGAGPPPPIKSQSLRIKIKINLWKETTNWDKGACQLMSHWSFHPWYLLLKVTATNWSNLSSVNYVNLMNQLKQSSFTLIECAIVSTNCTLDTSKSTIAWYWTMLRWLDVKDSPYFVFYERKKLLQSSVT